MRHADLVVIGEDDNVLALELRVEGAVPVFAAATVRGSREPESAQCLHVLLALDHEHALVLAECGEVVKEFVDSVQVLGGKSALHETLDARLSLLVRFGKLLLVSVNEIDRLAVRVGVGVGLDERVAVFYKVLAARLRLRFLRRLHRVQVVAVAEDANRLHRRTALDSHIKVDDGAARSRDVIEPHALVVVECDGRVLAVPPYRDGAIAADGHVLIAEILGDLDLRLNVVCRINIHREKSYAVSRARRDLTLSNDSEPARC